jgi:anti-sigma regulatory factor (Ser/Thr protein kinase)
MPFEHGEPAAPLRSKVSTALAHWHPSDYVEDVLLVVSELVQNVTQHTKGGGTLAVSWDDDSITVEVRDEDRVLPRPQPPDSHRVGGRGLLLVSGIATSWGTTAHDTGKTVWAQLAVPAEARIVASA